MGVPFSSFMLDLTIQRHVDARTCLEVEVLKAEELQTVYRGIWKSNCMWWLNKLGFGVFAFLLYKGKLLERGKSHGLSFSRFAVAVLVAQHYLFLGDYLAASLLWNEAKYVFYKYEPIIRTKRKGCYEEF
mmetsp:Transcript_13228/g.19311  ORF Transcript_13228/g.19311 Transcript_13228/m.19311 type:complete len:130 (+) Transcript_13228:62-451(+)